MLFPTSDQTTGDWKSIAEYCGYYNSSPISGLRVYWSKLPSISDFEHIKAATNKMGYELAGSNFWLSDYYSYSNSTDGHYGVHTDGGGPYKYNDSEILGARPLITLVK